MPNTQWTGPGLNRRHQDFQSCALPTELPVQSREGSPVAGNGRTDRHAGSRSGSPQTPSADTSIPGIPFEFNRSPWTGDLREAGAKCGRRSDSAGRRGSLRLATVAHPASGGRGRRRPVDPPRWRHKESVVAVAEQAPVGGDLAAQ